MERPRLASRLWVAALVACTGSIDGGVGDPDGAGGAPDGATLADAAPATDAPVPRPDAAPIDAGGVGPDECPAAPPLDPIIDWVPEAPGPIVRYTARPYYTVGPDGVTTFDPVIDGDITMGGVWRVPLGHTLVADSFQKNADNQLCQWVDLPVWTVEDPFCAVYRLGMRNPFLFKARTEHAGELVIRASIDGITSNDVRIRVEP